MKHEFLNLLKIKRKYINTKNKTFYIIFKILISLHSESTLLILKNKIKNVSQSLWKLTNQFLLCDLHQPTLHTTTPPGAMWFLSRTTVCATPWDSVFRDVLLLISLNFFGTCILNECSRRFWLFNHASVNLYWPQLILFLSQPEFF